MEYFILILRHEYHFGLIHSFGLLRINSEWYSCSTRVLSKRSVITKKKLTLKGYHFNKCVLQFEKSKVT